jgi:glycosyltransferase involved in cell wall biosynthesis
MADRRLATREREMLARLEVGLADESVRVLHAVPREVLGQSERLVNSGISLGSRSGWPGAGSGELADAGLGLFSTPIGWETGRFAFGRSGRVDRLHTAIRASLENTADDRVDIVHAFGAGCWSEAAELSVRLSANLVIEVCESACIGRASGFALGSGGGLTPTFLTGEGAVRDALLKRAPKARVELVPWGVHAPKAPREPAPINRPLGIAILADGSDARSVMHLLAGLQQSFARVRQHLAGLEPILLLDAADTSARRTASAWAQARRLSLLDRLTLVGEMEARREPVLDMDMLVLAGASGRQRTLTLDAMAAGVPVLARADPFVRTLSPETSKLVHDSSAAAWNDAFQDLLRHDDARLKQIANAHAFVKQERLAAFQVAGMLKVYDQLMQSTQVRVF